MKFDITEAQLRVILTEIQKVIDGPGFGTVAIVIEKGRVRRIRTTVDEWLEPRPEPPATDKGRPPPR